jgi:hypothetical protein
MNNGTWSGGKGSIPRKVNKKAYDDAFDRIFKKDIPVPEEVTPTEDKKKEPTEKELTEFQKELSERDLAFYYGCIVSISLSLCIYVIIFIICILLSS